MEGEGEAGIPRSTEVPDMWVKKPWLYEPTTFGGVWLCSDRQAKQVDWQQKPTGILIPSRPVRFGEVLKA